MGRARIRMFQTGLAMARAEAKKTKSVVDRPMSFGSRTRPLFNRYHRIVAGSFRLCGSGGIGDTFTAPYRSMALYCGFVLAPFSGWRRHGNAATVWRRWGSVDGLDS